MNLKTTFILLIVLAAIGVVFWSGPTLISWLGHAPPTPNSEGAGTLAILSNDLAPAKISRVEVRSGDRRVQVERGGDNEWSMPGRWPTRGPEVWNLIGTLGDLRSRFAPIPAPDDETLATYNLKNPALTVVVQTNGVEHRLAFAEAAEPSGDSNLNRFSRPTYLHVDDLPEVARLAPGLIGMLDRPADYYQQRRLFPSERVAKDAESQEKVERLAAQSIAVKDKKANLAYALARQGDDWELKEPVRDRVDPDKLKTLLAAVPDVWAEQFVEKPKKDLAEYGLNEPEQTVAVSRPGGGAVTLLIGKQSQVKTRTVARPPQQFGPPMPPQPDVIREEYHYAKLQDNDQIFEIRADKLKDIFVATTELRDPRVAHFRTEDVKKVELRQGGQEIVVVKDKDRWKLEKPTAGDAEAAKVTELLDKLAGLQCRDKEVLDKADPAKYGLDKPAGTLTLTAEEEPKGQPKKTTTWKLALGQATTEPTKLFVKVDGWDRINSIPDDGLLKLVQRPALAYRGRRVLDFAVADLDHVDVQRAGEALSLKQTGGVWKLTSPTAADADALKASKLAGDLANLEVVEFLNDNPKPEELDGQYGLAKPALTATLAFNDAAKKPPQTLQIGKQRAGKPEFFAKLASAPSVFVVKGEVRDAVDQSSLTYRPLQLWQLAPDDIAAMRIQKAGQEEYRVARNGTEWSVSGPFDASVPSLSLRPLTDELAAVRAERYEAHAAKDLAPYGLDKPYLKLALTTTTNDNAGKPAVKERTLLLGKPTADEAATRFGKLADSDAVFVVGGKLLATADHDALDLLDRKLLAVDPTSIDRIRTSGASGGFVLQKKDADWRVIDSPAPPFTADSGVLAGALGVWLNLHAQRFAAFGPKSDLARFGLDKPERTIVISTKPAVGNGAKAEPAEHTLVLGKAVGDKNGDRYARLDNGPGVVVLDAAAVTQLAHGYLNFVDHAILKLDPATIQQLSRTLGDARLEAVKENDGSWRLHKPAERAADEQTLRELTEQLSKLRAARVAAYPFKDLKEFGLDKPAAVVTLRESAAGGTKVVDHALKIGKAVGDGSADRFALREGSSMVGVLPGALVNRLLADPIKFQSRELARFPDADRMALERGPRKATFAKVDGTWKLTEPVKAEAEQLDLEDFLNGLARLRADELVAEKPADLQPFGLDKPLARYQFFSGDKEVMNLLVGAQEKNGPRVYAKLAAGDVIFVLSPTLSAKALGEFRNRTLWSASLDAAQVERLTITAPKQSFTLAKTDNAWQAVGKPEAKVKTERVNETLAALAGLRAERYVVDKGADLKLYGLEPAELVIEVQAPTGKRTLHVGRTEGNSRRFYARVPDVDRSDVFLLPQEKGAELVRDLAAFTK
jgi:hypothetical protein